jgi:uncharacterized protein (DUF111 family)
VGYGAGERDIDGLPNLLRMMIGSTADISGSDERVFVIETNIDDMNPQIYDYMMERLFEEGALDVFLTPVIMKKSRPAAKVTVLCRGEKRIALSDILIKETTTIGLRYYEAGRMILKREFSEVETPYGRIRFKISNAGGITKSSPEYEDCKKAAKKQKVPLLEVIEEVKKAAASLQRSAKKNRRKRKPA